MQQATVPVPSPFLPSTSIQFAWDSSSLGLFKTCPRLYQLTMIDGWTPKAESVHLRFGSEYHLALQEYDILRAKGASHTEATRATVASLLDRVSDWNPDRDTRSGRYKNRDTLTSLVVDYLDKYADDPATTYIKADGTPAVELSFKFELDWGPKDDWQIDQYCINTEIGETTVKTTRSQPYLLCGHLDRVVEFNSQLLVMDRKTTTSTLGGSYFAQWEPNNQMTLYTLAGKMILNAPVRGVIIDAAQIMLSESNRFVRGFTYRTDDQLDEWLADLRETLVVAEACATRGYWPMNDTSCDKFGGCRFRSICSKSPAIRDKFLAADFVQAPVEERWNPLIPR